MQSQNPREARLKPEFAHLYPPLRANTWELAIIMTERLMAWHLEADRWFMQPDRLLSPEHFEFRGGAPASSSQGRRKEERASSADQ